MESSTQQVNPDDAGASPHGRTWLMFSALTGAQAVVTMIRAAAVFTGEAGRSCNTEAVVKEATLAYDIGTALASELLAGKLAHSFKDGALLLHLSDEQISLLPLTATYSRLH